METTTKRAPAATGSARRTAAKRRRHVAQKLCHLLSERLPWDFPGEYLANSARSGALMPLPIDFLHEVRLAMARRDPGWRPPKGAELLVARLAMTLRHWKLPKGHPHAGEPGTGWRLSYAEMATIAGCSADQCYRELRPFVEHFDLIVGAPTTRNGTHRGRRGETLNAPEARTHYEPGGMLIELLGLRDAAISRRRRAVIAEVVRELGDRPRTKADPKALLWDRSLSQRSLARRRLFDLARTYFRRRRGSVAAKKPRANERPSAASLSTSSPPAIPVTSPATTVAGDQAAVGNQRLVTKGASAGADVAGDLQTPRIASPPAPQEAIALSTTSPPSLPTDVATATAAPPARSPAPETPGPRPHNRTPPCMCDECVAWARAVVAAPAPPRKQRAPARERPHEAPCTCDACKAWVRQYPQELRRMLVDPRELEEPRAVGNLVSGVEERLERLRKRQRDGGET